MNALFVNNLVKVLLEPVLGAGCNLCLPFAIGVPSDSNVWQRSWEEYYINDTNQTYMTNDYFYSLVTILALVRLLIHDIFPKNGVFHICRFLKKYVHLKYAVFTYCTNFISTIFLNIPLLDPKWHLCLHVFNLALTQVTHTCTL